MPTRKRGTDKKAKPRVKVEDLEPVTAKSSGQADEGTSPRGGAVSVRYWDPSQKKEFTGR